MIAVNGFPRSTNGSINGDKHNGEELLRVGKSTSELEYTRSNSRIYAIGEPSDPAVYAWVAQQQGRNLLDDLPEGAEDDEEFTPAELAVRQDFVKQKAQWFNDWRKDWWEFTRNFNPVLTLCYVHPLHPITRRERTMVYCVQVLLALYVSSFLALGEVCSECDIGCASDSSEPIFNSTGNMLSDCQPTKMLDDEEDLCCSHFSVRTAKRILERTPVLYIFGSSYYIAGALYSSLYNLVFALISFQLMLCGCVQNMSPQARKRFQYLGYTVFFCIGFALLWNNIPLIPYLFELNKIISVVLNFVITKMFTAIGMGLWGTFLFHTLWNLQAPAVKYADSCDEEESDGSGLQPNPAAGCCCGWPSPPVRNADGDDDRGCASRLASPLFHLTAQEYLEYVASQDDETCEFMLGRPTTSTWTLSGISS